MGLFTKIGDQIISKTNLLTHLAGGNGGSGVDSGGGNSGDSDNIVNCYIPNILTNTGNEIVFALDKTWEEIVALHAAGKFVIVKIDVEELVQ